MDTSPLVGPELLECRDHILFTFETNLAEGFILFQDPLHPGFQ